MTTVISLSGGVSSWAAGRRWIDQHGIEGVRAVFADTGVEDADTYRFVRESAEQLEVPLDWLGGDETIWDVFKRRKFLGNSRIDTCSQELKRKPLDAYLRAFAPSDEPISVVVGIAWDERHRFDRMTERNAGNPVYRYVAPLCDLPYLWKDDLHKWAESCGLAKQYLYRIGADHANCVGGCIKMGMGGFVRLLRVAPERYAEWERNEAEMQESLGKPVTILRDRTGGASRPRALAELRQRTLDGGQLEMYEQAACGCFSDADPEAA